MRGGWARRRCDRCRLPAGEQADRPVLIVAKTVKGHGVSFLADRDGWHGKALSEEKAATAVEELGGERSLTIKPAPPQPVPDDREFTRGVLQAHLHRATGDPKGVRQGACRPGALPLRSGRHRWRGGQLDLYRVLPDRFIEVFIAEQLMVGAAVDSRSSGSRPLPPPSGHFSPGPTTSSGWLPVFTELGSSFPARTTALESARTVRRRWRSRTSP